MNLTKRMHGLAEPLKAYYCREYPEDELGQEMPEEPTFTTLFDYLDSYQDVYSLMGRASDSIIRERLFSRLAELMEADYDYIYQQWLLGATMRRTA